MEGPREHGPGFGGCGVGPGSVGWGMSIHSLPAAVHGSRPEEVIDHRLTEREWAEEWKHLNNVSVQARVTVPTATPGALHNPWGRRGRAQVGFPLLCARPEGHGGGAGGRHHLSPPSTSGQSLRAFPSLALQRVSQEGHWAWGWGDPFNTISRIILALASFLGGSPGRRCGLQGGDGRVCSAGQTVPQGLKGRP